MGEPKKQPEEITDVPLPEKEMSPEELNRVAGGTDHEPFHVVKFVDASSPKLYESGTSGQPTTPPAK